jgi:hypothetical protein
MIYECQQGHICFSSNDDLNTCAMTGCTKSTIVISPIDIKIIEDPNMPKDVKKQITKIFPHLS